MAQCIKPTLLSQWNVSIFIPRIAIKLLSSMNEVGESLLLWLWIIVDYQKRETASKVRHSHCRAFEEIWGKFSVPASNQLNYTMDAWWQWPSCSFIFWFLLCSSERKSLSMSHPMFLFQPLLLSSGCCFPARVRVRRNGRASKAEVTLIKTNGVDQTCE